MNITIVKCFHIVYFPYSPSQIVMEKNSFSEGRKDVHVDL